MKIDTTVIKEYQEILESVCKLFEDLKIQKKDFCEAIKMERHTFSRKVKDRSFTPQELLGVAELFNKTFQI